MIDPIKYIVYRVPGRFGFVALLAGQEADAGWSVEYNINPLWVDFLTSDSCTPAIHEAHKKLFAEGWRVIRADSLAFHSNTGYLVWLLRRSDRSAAPDALDQQAWLIEGLPGDAGFPVALVQSDDVIPTVVRNQYGQVPASLAATKEHDA